MAGGDKELPGLGGLILVLRQGRLNLGGFLRMLDWTTPGDHQQGSPDQAYDKYEKP